jgi:hypothetical protein
MVDKTETGLTFITMRQPAMNTPGYRQSEHQTSLGIGASSAEYAARCFPEHTGAKEAPHCLQVVGVLSHGAMIMPATRADRNALVKFLRAIPYPRREPLTYHYRGTVERGAKYKPVRGYSLNGVTYPWLTRREAQREAAARGFVARFVEKEG